MILWIALLFIGILLYVKMIRNSAHKRNYNRKTFYYSFAMALFIGFLMTLSILNGNSDTALSYFVHGLGAMSIIAILLEAIFSMKKESSQK